MNKTQDVLDHIEWEMNTITERLLFGLDDLNAAYSRERRAKRALLTAKIHIKKLQKEIDILRQYGNKDCTAMADEVLKISYL